MDWHPTRRTILIGTRFADTNQVHEVAAPLGERRQLTFFADRVLGASYHPHLGDYFILAKDKGGNEFYQFYRQNPTDGATTLITDGKSRNTDPVWSTAGKEIVYGSTKRNKNDVDFYLMNPAEPGGDKLLCENAGGGWMVVDWSNDDQRMLALEGISINESYIWLVDVASGAKTLVTPKGSAEKIAYEPVAFARDGHSIYVLTDRESEFMRLARLDLETKRHNYLTSTIPWDVESARLSFDGHRLAFVTNENGISRLRLLDTATDRELGVPELPTGVIGNLQWHENSRELGFVITSAHSPADVYSLDLPSGRVDRWTISETGGLDSSTFVEPKLVKWTTFDGREISGFLYSPPARFSGKRTGDHQHSRRPRGAGTPHLSGPQQLLPQRAGRGDALSQRARLGRLWQIVLEARQRHAPRRDVQGHRHALLDWIATRDDLDADRVMITGGSYGGHMTLAVAVRYNDRIRCSLDVVGISNLVTFLERTEGYRRDLRRVEYGDERDPQMRKFLESIAPLNHAADIKKPLFVVQGKNDPRVPLSESEQIIETARKNDTPVWYLMAQDEGHGFAKKKNADYQFYATILFIEKFLLGDSQPN